MRSVLEYLYLFIYSHHKYYTILFIFFINKLLIETLSSLHCRIIFPQHITELCDVQVLWLRIKRSQESSRYINYVLMGSVQHHSRSHCWCRVLFWNCRRTSANKLKLNRKFIFLFNCSTINCWFYTELSLRNQYGLQKCKLDIARPIRFREKNIRCRLSTR